MKVPLYEAPSGEEARAALDPATPAARLWELAFLGPWGGVAVRLLRVDGPRHLAALVASEVLGISLQEAAARLASLPWEAAQLPPEEAQGIAARLRLGAELAFALLPAVEARPGRAVLVAQNPGAPASLLWALSCAEDPEVRRAVVQNPNAPFRLLACLGAEFPREAARNPCLSLLSLGGLPDEETGVLPLDPWFHAETLSEGELWCLARLSQPRALCALARRPLLTPALQEHLAASSEESVRLNLLASPAVSDRLLRRMCTQDPSRLVRERAALLLAGRQRAGASTHKKR